MPHEKLKAAIIEAVPEIMVLKFGCRVRSGTGIYTLIYQKGDEKVYTNEENMVLPCNDTLIRDEILGRPITLADVLVAIKKQSYSFIGLADEKYFVWSDSISMLFLNECPLWNLSTDLDGQSEETKSWLESILCPPNKI